MSATAPVTSTVLTLLAAAVLMPRPALADRASNPADATVFVRIIGERHATYGDVRRETVVEHDVEIATGSGFVVSPFGYVVTDEHVVADRRFTRQVRSVPVDFSTKVSRIEVVFPAGLPGAAGPSPAPRFEASVYAVDPERDLAVLLITGADFPYLALGDSDAIEPGAPITAMGYPFGRMVEVARGGVPQVVPQVTTTRGEVSALRAAADGEAGYLQTSATLNPGNSGGPMLDGDGFAVAVARMVLTRGRNIGFGIPINRVKEFLSTHGLDPMLPTHRLELGPRRPLAGKGITLPLPNGFQDRAPGRLLADGRSDRSTVVLRIDRVASPWSLEQLEQALLRSPAFEAFTPGTVSRHRARRARTLGGFAIGHDPTGRVEVGMEYTIVELGRERVVARYVGPAEAIAFNRSVFVASLNQIDAERLLTSETVEPVVPAWRVANLPAPRAPRVTLPAGWIREPVGPGPCDTLSPPDATISASPPGDFTVAFRVAWWSNPGVAADAAARACSARRSPRGTASYAATTSWLGVSYGIEGVFLDLEASGLLQLEVVAPAGALPLVRPLLDGWATGAHS